MPASGRLTTHVLDTMHGKPASGMRFDLLMLHGDHSHHILTGNTDADGRAERPLLEGDQFHLGAYELIFHVGKYFERLGVDLETPFVGQELALTSIGVGDVHPNQAGFAVIARQFAAAAVPEPSSLVLVAAGLGGVVMIRRGRRLAA